MIMEQALESAFILPHAVSLQGVGMCIRSGLQIVFKTVLSHFNLYMGLSDTGWLSLYILVLNLKDVIFYSRCL